MDTFDGMTNEEKEERERAEILRTREKGKRRAAKTPEGIEQRKARLELRKQLPPTPYLPPELRKLAGGLEKLVGKYPDWFTEEYPGLEVVREGVSALLERGTAIKSRLILSSRTRANLAKLEKGGFNFSDSVNVVPVRGRKAHSYIIEGVTPGGEPVYYVRKETKVPMAGQTYLIGPTYKRIQVSKLLGQLEGK